MEFVLGLVQLVGPVLIAALASVGWKYMKQGVAAFDKIPALGQQVLVIILAGSLAWVGAQIDVALPTDIHLFTEADIAAGLAGAFSLILHNAKKTRELGNGGV